MDDYSSYDGVGLAELVAKGKVSPAELTEAAIARIERHNPTLNAVVFKGYDDARKQAAGNLPDGPFKGVPFLIKDLAMPVAGWPRSSGSRYTRGFVDAQDGGLTARYRASGAVLLGKTNTPEYGITGTTESGALGPCRNPWNPGHISGGSSGGSASAVAAGIVPLAHASDGLGSIRIPAACCGLVGLKVTRDRVPNLPDGYDYAFGNVVDHVVSRTVRDSAVMLDATGICRAERTLSRAAQGSSVCRGGSAQPRQAPHRVLVGDTEWSPDRSGDRGRARNAPPPCSRASATR